MSTPKNDLVDRLNKEVQPHEADWTDALIPLMNPAEGDDEEDGPDDTSRLVVSLAHDTLTRKGKTFKTRIEVVMPEEIIDDLRVAEGSTLFDYVTTFIQQHTAFSLRECVNDTEPFDELAMSVQRYLPEGNIRMLATLLGREAAWMHAPDTDAPNNELKVTLYFAMTFSPW